MKKIMLFAFVTLVSFLNTVHADTQDPFSFLKGNAVLAITQHGSLAYEYGERNTRNVSLLDNVAEFGKFKDSYLVGIDAGIDGATAPQEGQTSIGWTAGGKLNLNALVNNKINVKPEWTFIKSLEYSVRYAYSSTLHHPRWTLAIAYGFGPATPK